MTITGDQYGTFGPARFTPADGSPSFIWQYSGLLMVTDGTDYVWLADQNEWSIFECCGGRVNLLPDAELVSDTVEAAKRTSQFRVSRLDNLNVDLVQEMPEAGYNFVQTYTFTNPTTEPMSLKMILFNDQDHGGNEDIHDDRVGFVSGPMPRMYFIEDQDVAGPGDPGVDDRPTRISVITQPGPGLHYDGYLGVNPEAFAHNTVYYLAANRGIGSEALNTIQVMNIDFGSATLTGINRDEDRDGLIDSPGDVGGTLQFSVALPANGSTTLGINYVGGSLQNAVFQEAVALPGDYNGNGQLDAGDLDLQASAIATQNLAFDLTGDGWVNYDDRLNWVNVLRHTWIGDSNLDGQFSSEDFVAVFTVGKYEKNEDATWVQGDWDGDKRFSSGDFVAAFKEGGYEKGPRAAAAVAVPEPSSLVLALSLMLGVVARRRTQRP
jgi:hypothetical protein